MGKATVLQTANKSSLDFNTKITLVEEMSTLVARVAMSVSLEDELGKDLVFCKNKVVTECSTKSKDETYKPDPDALESMIFVGREFFRRADALQAHNLFELKVDRK